MPLTSNYVAIQSCCCSCFPKSALPGWSRCVGRCLLPSLPLLAEHQCPGPHAAEGAWARSASLGAHDTEGNTVLPSTRALGGALRNDQMPHISQWRGEGLIDDGHPQRCQENACGKQLYEMIMCTNIGMLASCGDDLAIVPALLRALRRSNNWGRCARYRSGDAKHKCRENWNVKWVSVVRSGKTNFVLVRSEPGR